MMNFKESGFTIIEVMMFLAVTGLLAAGIMTGTGTSLNNQRYRDSVSSFEHKIKEQYTNINNVSIEHNSNWSCNSNGIKSDTSGSDRGRSDCAILGKYITYDQAKNAVIIRTVTGTPMSDASSTLYDSFSSATGAEGHYGYDIKVSSLSDFTEEYNLEWGSSLTDVSGKKINFSILIIKSPSTGVTETFIDPTEYVSPADAPNTLISAVYAAKPIKIYIKPEGFSIGAKMALYIKEYASGSNYVETVAE